MTSLSSTVGHVWYFHVRRHAYEFYLFCLSFPESSRTNLDLKFHFLFRKTRFERNWDVAWPCDCVMFFSVFSQSWFVTWRFARWSKRRKKKNTFLPSSYRRTGKENQIRVAIYRGFSKIILFKELKEAKVFGNAHPALESGLSLNGGDNMEKATWACAVRLFSREQDGLHSARAEICPAIATIFQPAPPDWNFSRGWNSSYHHPLSSVTLVSNYHIYIYIYIISQAFRLEG